MPVLRATIEHESGCGQRFAKFAPLYEAKTGLNSRTKKGVWRAPDFESAGRGRFQNEPTVVAGRSQRFLREHVLSGAKGRQADLRVCERNGQVDDQLNFVGAE